MWVFKDNWSKEDTLVAAIVSAAIAFAIGVGGSEFFSSMVTDENPITQWILALTGIVAVYLLYRTLQETRQTLELATETNEIIRHEQRPWLSLTKKEPETFCITRCDPSESITHKYHYELGYSIKNHGKSPAKSVGINSVFLFGPNYKDIIIQFENNWESFIQENESETGEVIFQDSVDDGRRPINNAGVLKTAEAEIASIGLVVVCQYRTLGDQFGGEVRLFIWQNEKWREYAPVRITL